MKTPMFLMTLFVLSGFSQVSATCMPTINPTLQAVIAFGDPIEVQDDPGPPPDTGNYPDHNTDSDNQGSGGAAAGGAGTPVTYNCKEETCRIRNEFDGKLYRCTCCKPNGSGQKACTQCDTFTCSGSPID